ncbi:tRNA (5-methylaminomethyl-2-thiouridine)(34)-methyltransferase MnmD [Laspinema olomoucense]|uniref:tRNA (5-methylaminomethyl-2-thiouridine)(34)-methyltransferase MnmD n=1 Tax=Laspinema olomoucense TaxID=3231600 RepID=UPI0021BAECB6|nr:MnmC family methyltransferase [Laspinema sp. D3a]MCT7987248.1 MnmC family methyltransferase [Laspinema sp. D3a]
MAEMMPLTPQKTSDGSFTFYSPEFGELFHSYHGARQEARCKFVEPTELAQKAHKPGVRVLDLCYGLGYNTASALETIWSINPTCLVEWVGLELDAAIPQAAIAQGLLKAWPSPIPELLGGLVSLEANGESTIPGVHCSVLELQGESGASRTVRSPQFQGTLWLGDARKTIQQVVNQGFQADAIFLDPFSPPNCPQLWTVEFLGWVARCLSPTGKLATYSCSASVRTALMAAGLKIGATAPVGRRSPGTVASFGEGDLPLLSAQEQEHLQTRAATPYRDPKLSDSAEEIRQRRQQEQDLSPLEPTSSWKKRWANIAQK